VNDSVVNDSDVNDRSGMSSIFISYRRDDSAETVGRLFDRLVQQFGRAAVFKDVDSIPPGADFAQHIAAVMQRCSVVLAMIGPRWLSATDAAGMRRLDDPGDFVRLEIETALARGITVIPLLVQGATMPPSESLPPSLGALAQRNAMPIRPDPDFHADTSRLIGTLVGLVPAPPTAGYAEPTGGPWVKATLLFGLLFGLLPAALGAYIGVAIDSHQGGDAALGGADVIPLLATLFAIGLVVHPLAFSLAGYAAARRSGRVGAGTFAAMIASLLASVVGLVSLIAGVNAMDARLATTLDPEVVQRVANTFVEVFLGLAVLNIGVAAGIGALGGLIGRSGYLAAARRAAQSPASRHAIPSYALPRR
jgi:hypothetical protein